MLDIAMDDAVRERLRQSLEVEGAAARVRIREYSTGTPCCRRTVLGFTIDEREDGDAEADMQGLPFVMQADLVEKWGGAAYLADLDEHGVPRIVARG